MTRIAEIRRPTQLRRLARQAEPPQRRGAPRRARHSALALAAALCLGAVPTQRSEAAACVFNPAAGNWNAPGNWSCGIVPSAGADSATVGAGQTVTVSDPRSISNLTNQGTVAVSAASLSLSGGGTTNTGGVISIAPGAVLDQIGHNLVGGTVSATGTGALRVNSSAANFLNGVTLGGTMDMASIANSRQRVVNGLTLNNATVQLNQNAILSFEGTSSLGGSGTIVLGGTGGGNRIDLDGNGTTTVGANVLVRGQNGTIGQQINIGGTQTLANAGTISADVAGGVITLTQSAVENSGILRALNGGTLVLDSNVTGTGAGQIIAGAGSTVLQNGVTLTGTINTSGSGLFSAISSAGNRLDGVTFTGNLDMATIANSRERVGAGGLVLNGTVQLNQNAILSFEGDGGLSGNATIVLGNTGGANRIDFDGNGTTTFAAGVTVRGQNGTIGREINIGGTQTLVNHGLVSADVAGGVITLTQSGVVNHGTLQAINGGQLVLDTNVTGGPTGQIVAGAGSQVLQSGVTISGTVNTSGSGLFSAISSSANRLDNATLNGNLDMATIANSRERVTGGALALNGTVQINQNGILSFEDTSVLSGNATIVLGSTGGGNRIDLDGNGTTTFGVGTTVQGHSGTIGQQINVGGTQTLVNQGTISANVAGGTVVITQSDVLNSGVLSALNGGTLVLNSHVTGVGGGQIVAGAGSTVLQTGVTLAGTINTSGDGLFSADASSFNRLSGVTFNGNLDMASQPNSRERVTAGGLVLNGAVNLNQNGNLSFEGDGALTGNATIVLGSTGAGNRIDLDGNGTTSFGANVLVRGQNGTIGQQINIGGTQTLANAGTISADVAGGVITLTESAVVNSGILRALNGGTLVLNSNVTGTGSGQIIAGAGSTVLQNGVTLTGTINTSGSGLFSAISSAGNRLDGVTFTGNLDMANIANSRERVGVGGLVLNGSVQINQNGNLSFEGDGGLSGNATIVLGNTGSGNRIDFDSNGTTTFAAGVTVRGQNGTIGQQINIGGTQTLVNNGLVSADVLGGVITLTESAVQNNNRLEARNGGTLVLNSAVTQGASGLILADNGVVRQAGVQVTGGVIDSVNGGGFQVSASGANYLNAVTVNGVMDMATEANSRQRVVNGMTLNGTASLNQNAILSFEGTSTLGGSGSIVLGNAGAGNRIDLDGNGTTTIGAGVTVRGHSGTIGQQLNIGGTQTLVNLGTIHADTAGGTIGIVDSALVNNGVLRASAGTLNVAVPLSGSGLLRVDAGGTMNLANGDKVQGALALGGVGAVLNTGTGTLTLTGDYTNAAAGSGNTFDRRAGVSGPGQIVAGGDGAQVISGAGVTNGATSNATLTIGNVRVGANAMNVQVTNSGTVGPALRGAIQTSVNGANISDARLSGTGVTPGLYNAGAPGGLGGDLGITFTAASAGALAPLAGQVVNLRSLYENIPDQKLNIVLANGAAAFNAASGQATPSPVVVANQRVGTGASVALNVSNTAAAGAFSEDLGAGFAGSTGTATHNGGTVSGLVAGSSNGSAMRVGVDSSSAGAKGGSVTLNYQTLGTVAGVSNGLAAGAANGPQTINVSGNVYQVAAGQITSAPLNFGTVQVGQVVQRDLVLRNTATGPAGFVEDLNASFGATSGTGASRISGTGTLNGITAGALSSATNGNMRVSVDTSSAGTVNGSIAVQYASAGAVNGVSNGLGSLAVGSEAYGVSGSIAALASVINQAAPQLATTSVNLGAVRVGAASPTAFVGITNLATVAPQAALNASISSNGAPVVAGGSVNLLAPGQSAAGALQVGLNTAVAGNYTGANAGSATVSLVSDASNVGGCAPDCQLTLAPQTVSVSGKVYTQAIGERVGPAVVDFGIVRVGDTVSARNITVRNAAATSGLNDTLTAQVSGLVGPFTGTGAAGIGAQATGQVAVGLNTSAAGHFDAAAALGWLSHNDDMADVSAGAADAVQVVAQVNRLANAHFELLTSSGLLTQLGSDSYVLNLGTLELGDTGHWSLKLLNDVFGPADALDGGFNLAGADSFSLSGWNPFLGLQAGEEVGGLDVDFTATVLGLVEDTVEFSGFSVNTSDPQGLAQSRHLTIRATVVDSSIPGGGTVPEPGTLALLMLAGVVTLCQRLGTRRRAAVAA